MHKLILECPQCGAPFEYESDGEIASEIQCPHCDNTCASSEYSALCFCPGCHAKLSMTIDMVGSSGLTCPGCGRVFDDFSMKDNEEDDSEKQPPEHLLKDGAYFDKYQIERFVGAGGMAEVYLAQHMFFKRSCALKVMKPKLYEGNQDYVKRFVREGRICFKLDSPYIVKVYDTGRDPDSGLLYIAMEFVEGENLAKIAERAPFTEAELREVGLVMAKALAELQKSGIVHRDIKPANIIRDATGHYKLMDMGIARNTAADGNSIDGTMTMENILMGTPNYASPEQCRSAHEADIRSDIYSLGATLYHLATGKVPFAGTTLVEITLNVVEGKREPLKKLRGDLSSDFLAIVDSMMALEPGKRPQTPQALERLLKPARHRQLSTRFICIALLALLALGAALTSGVGMLMKMSAKDSDHAQTDHVENTVADDSPQTAQEQRAESGQGVENAESEQSADSEKSADSEQSADSEKSADSGKRADSEATGVQDQVVNVQAQQNGSPGQQNVPRQGSADSDNGMVSAEEETAGAKLPSGHPVTVEERLALAQRRYDFLDKKDCTAFEKRMKRVFKTQIDTLQGLLEQRKALLASPKGSYDSQMTRQFQEEIKEYTKSRNPDQHGYRSTDVEFSRKMIGMLASGKVDPDVQLEYSCAHQYDGNILSVVSSGRLVNAKEILSAWLKLTPREPGRTAVGKIVRWGGLEVIIQLLVYPIDLIDIKDGTDFPALLLRDSELVRQMISLGIDIDVRDSYSDRTLLLGAMYCRYLNAVEDLLLAGANPNARDQDGNTALHYAMAYGRNSEKLCRILLEEGANPRLQNKDGNTPLHLAVAYGQDNDNLWRLLLEAGGDTQCLNKDGRKPEELKIQYEFISGCLKGNVEMMRHALQNGASMDWKIPTGTLPGRRAEYCLLSPLEIAVTDEKGDAALFLLGEQARNTVEMTKKYSRVWYSREMEYLMLGAMRAPDRWSVADVLVEKRSATWVYNLDVYARRDPDGMARFLVKHWNVIMRYGNYESSRVIQWLEKNGYNQEGQKLKESMPRKP